jgi:hypothetical protein
MAGPLVLLLVFRQSGRWLTKWQVAKLCLEFNFTSALAFHRAVEGRSSLTLLIVWMAPSCAIGHYY